MILDRILAALSIAALIAFMSVLITYVRELDLTIITIIVLLMAVFDFYLLTRRPTKSDE